MTRVDQKRETTSIIVPIPGEVQEGEALFCYLDEAGNFDFSQNGSDFFIMTCVVTRRPFRAAMDMLHARYDLIENGNLTGYFHASEDRYSVRDKVFSIIEEHINDFEMYSVAVRKRPFRGLIFVEDPSPREVYQSVFERLIELMASSGVLQGDHIIVFTDDIPKSAKRKSDIKGSLKRALKRYLPAGMRYTLVHQRSEGELNLQIADYFCWAVFRSIERGDDNALRRIRKTQRSSLVYDVIDLSSEE